MRFKNHDREEIQEVNLIPMIDVLMSILTFFILMSMILASSLEGVDVKLPSEEAGEQQSDAPPPLMVKISDENELSVSDEPVNEEQLLAEVQAHLDEDPQNSAVVVAASQANYERVVQLLAQMRKVSSDRVSLGIQIEE